MIDITAKLPKDKVKAIMDILITEFGYPVNFFIVDVHDDIVRAQRREYANKLPEFISFVEDTYEMKSGELSSETRKTNRVKYRFCISYLWKKTYENSVSLSYIGECFGGRDHTTILKGINNVKDSITIIGNRAASNYDVELVNLLHDIEKLFEEFINGNK